MIILVVEWSYNGESHYTIICDLEWAWIGPLKVTQGYYKHH